MSRQIQNVVIALSLPALVAAEDAANKAEDQHAGVAADIAKYTKNAAKYTKNADVAADVAKYTKTYSKYQDEHADVAKYAKSYSKYQDQNADVAKYAKTYSKYLKSGEAAAHGDYAQKYKKSYEGYMKQSGDGSDAGDYQKYMKGYGNGGQQGNYQKYMDNYASNYASNYAQYMQKGNTTGNGNATEAGNGGEQYKHYYQQYMKYKEMYQNQSKSDELPAVPRDASECKTEDELKLWLDVNTQKVSKHMPKDYRHFAIEPLQNSYAKRLAELRGETTPPPAPFEADDCHTKKDLAAWRAAQEKSVHDSVPKAYQHFPLDAIKKAYEAGLKRIAAEAEQAKKEAAEAKAAKAKAKSAPPATQAPPVAQATKQIANVQPSAQIEVPADKTHALRKPRAKVHEAADAVDSAAKTLASTEADPAPAASAKDTKAAAVDAATKSAAGADDEAATPQEATPTALLALAEGPSSFAVLAAAAVALPLSAALRFFQIRRSRSESEEAPFLRMNSSP